MEYPLLVIVLEHIFFGGEGFQRLVLVIIKFPDDPCRVAAYHLAGRNGFGNDRAGPYNHVVAYLHTRQDNGIDTYKYIIADGYAAVLETPAGLIADQPEAAVVRHQARSGGDGNIIADGNKKGLRAPAGNEQAAVAAHRDPAITRPGIPPFQGDNDQPEQGGFHLDIEFFYSHFLAGMK